MDLLLLVFYTFLKFPLKDHLFSFLLCLSIVYFLRNFVDILIFNNVPMLVGRVGTYPYQSQLVMWRVVAQNCAKSCVPSIIR